MNTMNSIKVPEPLKLVLSILICQSAGLMGSVFTSTSIATWYVTLNKPFFTPPNWLFAPVWLTLYTLMGVAAFLVWQNGFHNSQVKRAVRVFGVQLILNAVWSGAFFGLQSPLSGLIVIIMLWIAIVATILKFFTISKTAGLLLIPYIFWVSIAAALNGAIVILN
ncbi:MAG TPA: TspO/MBR family protein [Desulfobacteria bacterium]|nr:TspO/MBR family protein [Desulfobacteria bacterium]